MASEIETRVFKSVNEISKDALDSIVDDSFFTYGWLKTLEISKPPINLDPFYVAAYHKGELVAFTPCFRDIAGQYFQYGPPVIPYMKKVLNVYNRLRLGKNNVLLCYSPWCFRTKVFFNKSINEGLLLRKLSESIDHICKEEKILFSSFLFVSEYDQNLKLQLEDLRYHGVLFWKPMLYLDVCWCSFEEYLESFNSHIRKNIKREIRKCSENGVTIERVPEFKSLSMILSDLSLTNFLKYNKWAQRLESLFFESLYDYAKANTVVFIAKKNDEVIGFSLCLRKGEMLDVFMCGFNYELQSKSDLTYFNLLYYAPINYAIEENIKKIYYRWGSEKVKTSRGCKPERLYSLVKCHNILVNSQIDTYMKIRSRMMRVR